jgi:hypothetical protein
MYRYNPKNRQNVGNRSVCLICKLDGFQVHICRFDASHRSCLNFTARSIHTRMDFGTFPCFVFCTSTCLFQWNLISKDHPSHLHHLSHSLGPHAAEGHASADNEESVARRPSAATCPWTPSERVAIRTVFRGEETGNTRSTARHERTSCLNYTP